MTATNTPGGSRLADYMARVVAAAPVPPPEVLNRQPIPADVREFPVYFVWGPGRVRAAATLCPHGYTLVDSCPCCDADESAATA